MNTTKVTLSLAAVLCILLLWPAQASAGCSLHLSIGGYIGSACVSCSHQTSSHAGSTYAVVEHHRRLLGHPPLRPCASPVRYLLPYRPTYWSSISRSPRPVRREVYGYDKPPYRVARHGSRSHIHRTTVSRVEVRHR